jgi:hypothetical protein
VLRQALDYAGIATLGLDFSHCAIGLRSAGLRKNRSNNHTTSAYNSATQLAAALIRQALTRLAKGAGKNQLEAGAA